MQLTKRGFSRYANPLLGASMLLLVLTVSGCGRTPSVTSPPQASQTPPPQIQPQRVAPQPSQTPTATTQPQPSTALTPRQMAGQRIIYGYPGLTPPADLLWLIRHGEAAGVIFFPDNISGPAQLRRVTAMLERANASRYNPVRAPLLLMTDQEGGRMRRLPGAPLLSQKQIGESATPRRAAAAAGSDAARNLRSVGLNVNLAPVLDVYRTAGDFDDHLGRSYSSDPAVAGDLGAEFIRAQQSAGVAATAKHFPGLGAATTKQDTDQGPVSLPNSLHALRTIDELPFKDAVAARVKLIMVSWAVYPALDPQLPAGFSRIVTTDTLRGALGFRGVSISDGMLAGATEPYGPIGDRADLAAKAGLDLLICGTSGSSPSVGRGARDALLAGYLDRSLDRAEFKASVQRVIALRKSLGNGSSVSQ